MRKGNMFKIKENVMNLNALSGTVGVNVRKAAGYLSTATGIRNTYSRQLASANKPFVESSSVDILRTIKRMLSKKNWLKFLNEELPGLKKFRNLGIVDIENLAAQEFGSKMGAKNWKEYVVGLIDNPSTGLTQNSTCLDFVRKALPGIK